MGNLKKFNPRGGGGTKRPSDVVDRAAHARALLQALEALPNPQTEGLPGIYLDVQGRPGESMVTTGLNSSELTLLKFEPGSLEANEPSQATVFASARGLEKFQSKITDFQTRDRLKADGSISRPYNANLAQSIGEIVEAGLRALWRSPSCRFPEDDGIVTWEIWLDRQMAEHFIATAPEMGVTFGPDRLEFPEDIVVIATASRQSLELAVRRITGVKALAAPTTTPDFFDELPSEEQAQWVADLQGRITYEDNPDPNYITLLDRGVSRAHPLIAPSLNAEDRHAADPAWSLDDQVGHGTQLAGLALYGDLHVALQSGLPISVRHRLESAKIIPDAGENPDHLLGAMTRHAINAAETSGERRRTFSLASTTDADTPHDGAPTSWSSEIDQLSAGVSGDNQTKRLFLISAGNSDQNLFGNDKYLATCDDPMNEVEAPSQAWNSICVGAYTEKSVLPAGTPGIALAPVGDLAPSSRTASWASHWPIKPDVVFEGGNWIVDGAPPPMKHQALSLLTTDHQYPSRSFTTTGDTSGATALGARAITELWSDYPDLWPETIRALLVSSARWTPQMLSHLPVGANKRDYDRLFQRYGYGVPDMERARRSASNALSMIVQDTISPYRMSQAKSPSPSNNEMKLFSLPWPVEELRRLGNSQVTLRIALSTFVEPNPSETSRGSKSRYASHNLRFKLNLSDENEDQFLARVNKESETPSNDDRWEFGVNRRDVGSLHIDQFTCSASDLARQNMIAVHPVGGWWKKKGILNQHLPSARFALVVEIDTEAETAQLYTEIETVIATQNLATIEV